MANTTVQAVGLAKGAAEAFNQSQSQETSLVLNNRGDLSVASGLPSYAELVRLGRTPGAAGGKGDPLQGDVSELLLTSAVYEPGTRLVPQPPSLDAPALRPSSSWSLRVVLPGRIRAALRGAL